MTITFIRHLDPARAQFDPEDDNASGFKGVSQASDGKRWEARIMKGGKIVWRENFGTPDEAHQAYIEKRNELFGDQWRD